MLGTVGESLSEILLLPGNLMQGGAGNVQKGAVTAESITSCTGDFPLHPLAVAAAEGSVGTFPTQFGKCFPLLSRGKSGGHQQPINGILQDIPYVVFIQAVEVAGIHAAIGLYHQLGLAVTVDTASGGHSVGHEIDYIVK